MQKNRTWMKEAFEKIKELGKLILSNSSETEKDSIAMSNLYYAVSEALMNMDDWVWLVDLYAEESTGEIFAILAKDGLLYRSSVKLNEDQSVEVGEMIQVKEIFEPISNNILIKQQDDGTVRWFLIASSNVLSRNATLNSGELFDNLINRCVESGKYPYITYYHLGEAMKMGITDWVARQDHLLLASGTFDDSDVAKCMQRAYSDNPSYWGASISFWPLEGKQEEISENVTVPVYTDGELEEISFLAEKDAKCLFTALKVEGKVNNMRKELEDAIKLLAGNDDLAQEFISRVDQTNQKIDNEGLISRGLTDNPTDENPDNPENPSEKEEDSSEKKDKIEDDTADVSAPEDDSTVVEIDAALVSEIVTQVTKSSEFLEAITSVSSSKNLIEELQRTQTEMMASFKKISDSLSARISKMEKSEEEKKTEWLDDLPKQRKVQVNYRSRSNQHSEEESPESLEMIANATLENIK